MLTAPASGTSLICSNPERARILARAKILLPRERINVLEARFATVAKNIGMTTWAVGSQNGAGVVKSKTLGLQSPEVSVSISARWKPGLASANVIVERTCYTDDLEPWKGYWQNFLSGIRAAGYDVRETGK
ncbi:MAG: hypothetical protein Q7J32_06925 [Sphingomonadaceae bacterium]|nr:hypothetical protein [Sphingomonadaceae bacterium]